MTVEIRPGTLRDICFIASNLRPEDRREVMASAQLANGTHAGLVAWHSSSPEWCWTVWLNDEPHAAFGISEMGPLLPHMRSAWAWGTTKFKRCAPAITRFAKADWPERLIAAGVTRVEIRSIEGHDLAHKWLAALPARLEGRMTGYGVNGETFELWAFLKSDWAIDPDGG